MTMIDEKSPCEATVTTSPFDEGDAGGGLTVEIFIPTYSGGVTLKTVVERSNDGDWRVYMPDVSEFDVHNDIGYLGAPEAGVECERKA